jgi:hypothetical protein
MKQDPKTFRGRDRRQTRAPPGQRISAPVPEPCEGSFRTEAVAGVGKSGVEDGIQYLQDHLLNQTVHGDWNAQLAFSSARLRNLHSTNGAGLVTPVQ